MMTWLRNLHAALQGWRDGAHARALERLGIERLRETRSRFLVMPWDVGLLSVRTDRYLALAEYAQTHYYSHHQLIWPLLRRRIAVVNKRVNTRHLHPVRLGDTVDIHTRVQALDDRHAGFTHDFYARGRLCARAEVQVVYRQARRSLPPQTVLPHLQAD